MANSTKLILCLLALIALIAIFVFVLKPNSDDDATITTVAQDAAVAARSSNSSQATNSASGKPTKSIADEWVWPEGEGVKELSAADMRKLQFGDKPYTLQSVYAALEAVRIDENGDLIIDSKALFALNEALERYYKNIDAQTLRELEELIKEALPGKVGEQTAELVRNYHGFLGAQDEFNQMHQYTEGPRNISEVERDRNLYSELQSLREVHLGTDTAQRLFAQADSGAQFMFDMMSLDMDSSLSEEERAIRRAAIQERFEQEQQEESDAEQDSGG